MNRCQPQPIESSSLAPTNKSDNSFSFAWRCRSPLSIFWKMRVSPKEKDKHWFQHSRKRVIYWNSSRAHSVQLADVNCQRVVFFARCDAVWSDVTKPGACSFQLAYLPGKSIPNSLIPGAYKRLLWRLCPAAAPHTLTTLVKIFFGSSFANSIETTHYSRSQHDWTIFPNVNHFEIRQLVIPTRLFDVEISRDNRINPSSM